MFSALRENEHRQKRIELFVQHRSKVPYCWNTESSLCRENKLAHRAVMTLVRVHCRWSASECSTQTPRRLQLRRATDALPCRARASRVRARRRLRWRAARCGNRIDKYRFNQNFDYHERASGSRPFCSMFWCLRNFYQEMPDLISCLAYRPPSIHRQ